MPLEWAFAEALTPVELATKLTEMALDRWSVYTVRAPLETGSGRWVSISYRTAPHLPAAPVGRLVEVEDVERD